MSLNYQEIEQNLNAVKTEIDDLLKYMKTHQSKLDRRFVDLEIYTRLANISTNVLKSDCHLPTVKIESENSL